MGQCGALTAPQAHHDPNSFFFWVSRDTIYDLACRDQAKQLDYHGPRVPISAELQAVSLLNTTITYSSKISPARDPNSAGKLGEIMYDNVGDDNEDDEDAYEHDGDFNFKDGDFMGDDF